MNQIDVCLSPELIHLYDLKGRIVVVVDILRATSCMTAGLANGVEAIHPVASLEACRALMEAGYIGAAERGGQKVDGFDIGNSPFSYMEPAYKGKKIAVTTTNGTVAIDKSKNADQVIIGSFLNLTAVAGYVRQQHKDIIILCAGWQGRVNLEDTLFAGALTEQLKDVFQIKCDAAIGALTLYNAEGDNISQYLDQSAHVQRLKGFNIQKDIDFCLTKDQFDVIPVLQGDELIEHKK
jgi:2-phosphosulfolactate phosphatase